MGHICSFSDHASSRAGCFEAGLIVEEEVGGKTVEKLKYVPYHLRHFYASVLIAKRKDPKTIQTLMGHEDIKTTLNVYGHLLKLVPPTTEPPSGMLASLRAN